MQENEGGQGDRSGTARDATAPGLPHRDEALPTPGMTAHVWRTAGSHQVGTLAEVSAALADPHARTWVDLDGADDTTLRALLAALELHHLLTEDVIETGRRAKLVQWGDVLQLVAFAVVFDDGPSAIEVDVLLGPRFVLTSHHGSWRPLDILERNGLDPAAMLGKGVDLVLHAILDPIVDSYFPVIDAVNDELDALEDLVLTGHDRDQLERLVRTRRWLLEARHLVSPMRDILDQLAERELPGIEPGHRLYFRDAHDQVVHVIEELDTQREIASGVLDAYRSGVSNSLAEVMKRLTAVTAVLAGVGAAAGIFGMSEAGTALGLPDPLGFWLIAVAMLLVGAVVFAYFRRIDWI